MSVYQNNKKKRKKYRANMQGLGMLKEDMNATANMPQESFQKAYPKSPYGGNKSKLNDTIVGIDKQMKKDSNW